MEYYPGQVHTEAATLIHSRIMHIMMLNLLIFAGILQPEWSPTVTYLTSTGPAVCKTDW